MIPPTKPSDAPSDHPTKEDATVHIYTDGACRGNPGPGGWGALLRFGEIEKEISGYDHATTNNRMELTAAIEALRALKPSADNVVVIHTDSRYVMDGVTLWIKNWKKNNWRTAGGDPVKNRDLWEILDTLSATHLPTWRWVKGHDGHVHNERADTLAKLALQRGIIEAG